MNYLGKRMDSVGAGGEQEKVMRGKNNQSILHTYMKSIIMKPTILHN